MLSTIRPLRLLFVAGALMFGISGLGAASASATVAPAESVPSVMGWFEGHWIRLADGWGEAGACTSDSPLTARCYRTAEDMEAAEAALPETTAGPASLLACSPSVWLYTGTGGSGSTLHLTYRLTSIDLSGYGFDNVTSSYSIGGCSSKFYDTSTGGTAYPGNTSAGASASSMLSGWDNRVSSVYIN